MARIAFDRAHEVSRPILGGDRSEVLGLGHRQCAAQVTCGIALGARRRDGITKNPAKHAAHPPHSHAVQLPRRHAGQPEPPAP